MGKRRKKRDSAPKEVRPPVANRVVERIEGWAAEAAEAFGLVLYDLNVTKQWLVQVFVDRVDSEESTGVAIDECAKVSRYMEALLDADEDVWTKYTIEVSSPGIERKLSKPRHFELSVGKDVRIVLT